MNPADIAIQSSDPIFRVTDIESDLGPPYVAIPLLPSLVMAHEQHVYVIGLDQELSESQVAILPMGVTLRFVAPLASQLLKDEDPVLYTNYPIDDASRAFDRATYLPVPAYVFADSAADAGPPRLRYECGTAVPLIERRIGSSDQPTSRPHTRKLARYQDGR